MREKKGCGRWWVLVEGRFRGALSRFINSITVASQVITVDSLMPVVTHGEPLSAITFCITSLFSWQSISDDLASWMLLYLYWFSLERGCKQGRYYPLISVGFQTAVIEHDVQG